MDDDWDTDPADTWPLPPAWMWGCETCADLYGAMKRAGEVFGAALEELGPSVDCDPFDTVVTTQIRLAEHLAVRHPEQLPEEDPTCAKCTSPEMFQLPERFLLEHRARHLFAPPSVVDRL
ncbi:hypothetical protein [Streptomyces reniochalinae]|uniref:Uncharacterized protein n=1 Tax=Streptomyces reniochalinae TaxID=2250578 RepID=A0A367EBU1_9ACTN|nr:hypothetical protein [Streptomyces reniochalinae]RCG15259.1 hypothetical protein DQ392_23995 [Streptomyces reniochalinae]